MGGFFLSFTFVLSSSKPGKGRFKGIPWTVFTNGSLERTNVRPQRNGGSYKRMRLWGLLDPFTLWTRLRGKWESNLDHRWSSSMTWSNVKVVSNCDHRQSFPSVSWDNDDQRNSKINWKNRNNIKRRKWYVPQEWGSRVIHHFSFSTSNFFVE